jgi:hypothetical protein
MSLRAAGRATQSPMVPAFPNLMSTTIAILPTVIPDTHRAFDLRRSGRERAFALLVSEKRVTARILVAVSRPLLSKADLGVKDHNPNAYGFCT